MNTLRGNWGYAAKKTSDFSFGTAQLFERDDYGPEVMYGAMPGSKTPEERNAVFNRTGQMLRKPSPSRTASASRRVSARRRR